MRPLSTREKIYVAIFILALIWGVWNYRHLFESAPSTASVAQPATHAAVALSISSEVAEPERVEAISNGAPGWGPDPFHRAWRYSSAAATPSSPAKVKRAGASLKLSAIVVRPDSRYAVINGGIVREGGMVAGRRVLKIESSRVVVDDNGTEVSLSL